MSDTQIGPKLMKEVSDLYVNQVRDGYEITLIGPTVGSVQVAPNGEMRAAEAQSDNWLPIETFLQEKLKAPVQDIEISRLVQSDLMHHIQTTGANEGRLEQLGHMMARNRASLRSEASNNDQQPTPSPYSPS